MSSSPEYNDEESDDYGDHAGYQRPKSTSQWAKDSTHGASRKRKQSEPGPSNRGSARTRDEDRGAGHKRQMKASPRDNTVATTNSFSQNPPPNWQPEMGQKLQYDRTKAILKSIAATGARGCTTMFPVIESEQWVTRRGQEAWTMSRAQEGLNIDNIPQEPSLFGSRSIRESLRMHRGTITRYVRDSIVEPEGATRTEWARDQLRNNVYECEDGQGAKRFLGKMLIRAIQHAFYLPTRLGRVPATAAYFATVNEHMLLSISTTLFCILTAWSAPPLHIGENGKPVYPSLDAPTVTPNFVSKLSEFRTWDDNRRARVLQLVTRRARAKIVAEVDPALDTDMHLYTTGLEGLESDEEDVEIVDNSVGYKSKAAVDKQPCDSTPDSSQSRPADPPPVRSQGGRQTTIDREVGAEWLADSARDSGGLPEPPAVKAGHDIRYPLGTTGDKPFGSDSAYESTGGLSSSAPPASSPAGWDKVHQMPGLPPPNAPQIEVTLVRSDFLGRTASWNAVKSKVEKAIGPHEGQYLWWCEERVNGQADGKEKSFTDDRFEELQKRFKVYSKGRSVAVYRHDMSIE